MDFDRTKSDVDHKVARLLLLPLTAAASERVKLRQNVGWARAPQQKQGVVCVRPAALGRVFYLSRCTCTGVGAQHNSFRRSTWRARGDRRGCAALQMVGSNGVLRPGRGWFSGAQLNWSTAGRETAEPGEWERAEQSALLLAAANPICNGPKVSSGRAAVKRSPRATARALRSVWEIGQIVMELQCARGARYH